MHQAVRLRRQARASRLAEIDRLKEELAYLKFWQGVVVVTLISLTGWLITSGAVAPAWTFLLAASGVIFLGIATIAFRLRVKQRIRKIGQP